MKRILVLLFLLPAFAKAQQPSAEALAKEFIAAVKANSKERVKKLYPDKPTMERIYSEMVQEDKIAPQDTAGAREAMADMDDELNEIYGDAMRKIKAKKINPAQIIYKSAKLGPDLLESEDMPKGVKMYKGVILITAAGKAYYIEVAGIVEYKGSYYGIEVDKVGLGTPKK